MNTAAKLLLSAMAIGLVSFNSIHNHELCEGIVEDNDMWISTMNTSETGGIDEATFNAVIDRMEDIYSEIISEKGGKLKVERNWNDGTVNAYASRSGKTWKVRMFGGLARHEVTTADGFALVVCHEIGHHIGGAPKKSGGWSNWATNEGQADYWGNLKCMRRYLDGLDHEEYLSDIEVPATAVELCENSYELEVDQLACQRMAMASQSLAFLFQSLRKEDLAPRFDTPSAEKVSKTFHNHPATQCRMDTYFQGGLCTADPNEDISDNDTRVGTCVDEQELGTRPLCWFAI